MARKVEIIRVPTPTTTPVANITPAEWQDVASLRAGFRHINLRSEGFALDGTTDETTAFQAVLDSATDGDVIVLDEQADLLLSGPVTVSGKRVSLTGHGGATITCTQKLTTPFITVSNAPRVTISGLRLIGAETTFDGVLDTQAYALKVSGCPDVVLANIRISGFSRGTMVQSSPRANVDNHSFVGVATGHVTNINFHSGLFISGSDDVKIVRAHAENCGSCVLVGSAAANGRVLLASGRNCYDNGVYISSGSGWEILSPSFTIDADYSGTVGTGVKMRGSSHTLLGGYFDRMGIGVVITGIGSDAGDGTNGAGSRVWGATTYRARWAGYSIETNGGLAHKDAVIMSCLDENSGTDPAGAAASYRVTAGFGHVLAYNRSYNWKNSDYAFSITGGTGPLATSRVTLDHNTIRLPQTNGVLVNSATYTRVDNTSLEGIPGTFGIRLANTTNSRVSGTRVFGTSGSTATIRVDGTGSGNRVIDNTRSTVSNAVADTLLSGNLDTVSKNLTVTGAKGGNAALTDLLAKLAQLGIITDSTS